MTASLQKLEPQTKTLQGRPETRPTLAPTVPLFVGLLAGILLSSGLIWPLVFVLSVALYDRRMLMLGAALLGLGLGFWRGHDALLPRANLLHIYSGQNVTLEGDWDGQFLHLKDPPSSVALSPRPQSEAGKLSVSGRLGDPPSAQNFGSFNYRSWLELRGVRSVLYGAKVKSSVPSSGFRNWFERGLHVGLTERQGALMTALELGDRDEVKNLSLTNTEGSLTVQTAFTRAGLAHLMALSGQHVAILVGMAMFALSGLGLWRYPLLIVLLGLYLTLVGVQPSIVRAVLQGGAVLLALWVGRGRLELVGTLALAGVLSLTVYPLWVFDIGFQLSYLAVLGIAFTPALSSRLPPWKGPDGKGVPKWLERGIKEGLVITVVASVATLPLIAHSFGQIPWVALPANIVCGPFMLLLVPLGLLSGFLGPGAVLINPLVGILCDVLLSLVGFFAGPDPIPWGRVSPAGFALYVVWAAALMLWTLRRIRAPQFLGLTLAAILVSALSARVNPPREIVFLNIGQGDSTLVRLGNFTALFDGGGTPRGDFDVGAKTVVPALHSSGVFHLDLVVATHADSDHIEGLSSVLRQMPVGKLWIGERKSGDSVLDAVLEAARERGVPVQEVRRGDSFSVGGAKFEVLWPQGTFNPEQDNQNSIVTRISSGSFRTAILGDVASDVENRLGLGPLTVHKVAHHGSRFSTDARLLEETRPQYAVISVGRNTYGHPNSDLLERLQNQGVKVLRTDRVGAIRFAIP